MDEESEGHPDRRGRTVWRRPNTETKDIPQTSTRHGNKGHTPDKTQVFVLSPDDLDLDLGDSGVPRGVERTGRDDLATETVYGKGTTGHQTGKTTSNFFSVTPVHRIRHSHRRSLETKWRSVRTTNRKEP